MLSLLYRWFVIVMVSGLFVPPSQASSDPVPQFLVEMLGNFKPVGGTIAEAPQRPTHQGIPIPSLQ